jgi:hypothetical protein
MYDQATTGDLGSKYIEDCILLRKRLYDIPAIQEELEVGWIMLPVHKKRVYVRKASGLEM